jgi:type VI secretion system protein ImpA
MNTAIDMGLILAAIPGGDPAGTDLRYSSNLYDDIREARRVDDPLLSAGNERELKTANWGKVIDLSLGALGQQSKDLQIATWLTEALASSEGFPGLQAGMRVLGALLENFWDELYPKIEDGDYDYRCAPFEFLNERVSQSLKQIPLTDPRSTPGLSYLKYQETREIAAKPSERERMVGDGKLPPEDFDNAVQKSSAGFYKALADALAGAVQELDTLEALVDGKFGPHAPSLSALGKVLEETQRLVLRICTEQKGLKDHLGGAPSETAADGAQVSPTPSSRAEGGYQPAIAAAAPPAGGILLQTPGGGESQESAIWNEALALMQKKGFREALDLLLAASSSQSSERGRCRYRFLVAKLCLKAGRPDLARPIVEQLNTMIGELQLERWECPFWVSEIFEALYQCLISGEDAYEEAARAKELFRKICTMDVTKALGSRV